MEPRTTHDCPVCTTSRALRLLEAGLDDLAGRLREMQAGLDALVEQGAEQEMAHAWLRDEVRAVVGRRLPFPGRKRLRKALEVGR